MPTTFLFLKSYFFPHGFSIYKILPSFNLHLSLFYLFHKKIPLKSLEIISVKLLMQ